MMIIITYYSLNWFYLCDVEKIESNQIKLNQTEWNGMLPDFARFHKFNFTRISTENNVQYMVYVWSNLYWMSCVTLPYWPIIIQLLVHCIYRLKYLWKCAILSVAYSHRYTIHCSLCSLLFIHNARPFLRHLLALVMHTL